MGAAACVSTGGMASSTLEPAAMSADASAPARAELSCEGCNSIIPIPTEVTRAIETRLADLRQRGGACSRYGAVLERSYRSGRITFRPYMWRVGSHLASGEAKPNGEMTLAREIDSLNVGVRTVDDVLSSMEHEAVHIAFGIASGIETSEAQANAYVRACRSGAAPSHAATGQGLEAPVELEPRAPAR
jgi:hypothetical protein